ncbi:hypothetical protein [Thalassotalea crassostreae]|uniref:hypothetical protein n=1 Tax=Thalassotalea crassostreae TaxID=1763536 RepID=UPI0008390403|nr:hypothetical protein [Thalassotalea crassostreae]
MPTNKKNINKIALWAIIGPIIGATTIFLSYWVFHQPIIGYKLLVGPGILAANLFSEEINFWPKITIMLTGQYIAYLLVFWTVNVIKKS